MGKRGQKQNRIKKEDIEKAEDAKILSEESTGSLLTDPNSIESEFSFESHPSSDAIPLNTPLAGETSSEGQTMRNLGFDVSELGGFEDLKTTNAPEYSNANASASGGGGDNTPPPKKTITMDDAIGDDNISDQIIDDVPPPNPNEKDLFDEVEGGDEGGGSGMALPPDFVTWAAEKQAEWIVQTEKIIANGFMQNRARISIIDVRQRLIKYKIPNDISKQIIHHVQEYNNDVETNLQVSKDAEKALKMSWVAVLKQHSNISEKITPEVALIINHAVIFGQLYFQGNEIKKYGKELLSDIDQTLKEYAKSNTPPPQQPKESGE